MDSGYVPDGTGEQRDFARVLPANAAVAQRLGPIAKLAPDAKPAGERLNNLLCWVCGCVLIYGSLFDVGKIIFKETSLGIGMLAVAAVAGFVIYWDLSRRGWSSIVD